MFVYVFVCDLKKSNLNCCRKKKKVAVAGSDLQMGFFICCSVQIIFSVTCMFVYVWGGGGQKNIYRTIIRDGKGC